MTSIANPTAQPTGETLSELPATLCEAFQATAARFPDAVALRTPGHGISITWGAYAARVKALAGGLAVHGIKRGSTVGMLLTNRPEAHLVDTAALHLGATPFSVYNTSSPEQLEYLLNHAACEVLVTERQFLDRVQAIRDRLEALRWVFLVDGVGSGAAGLDELAGSAEPDFDFEAAWRAVTKDDVATLIYTSGTTGPPKGVELTHDNVIWDTGTWARLVGVPMGGRLMSHLPFAHLADRALSHYLSLLTGSSVTCVSDPKQAVASLVDCRPTVWLGVPRVWEKLKAALEGRFAAEQDAAKRAAIEQALEVRLRWVKAEQEGEIPADLQAEADRADAVFAPLRASLGFDADTFLVSGAAAIPREVVEFFGALGLPVNEGYGMTECSCVTTLNRPGARRYGTVGKPLPGVELSHAEDGELLVRGRLVMRGYRNDPQKTAEAVDPDGWFHTGDIGELDADGFLRIVDRKKEIIINAAGKNMSPANIEAALKSGSKLIGIPVVIGNSRPYNTALIVLETDAVSSFVAEHGLGDLSAADLARHPLVHAEVEAGVARANERLSRVEQIKRFTIMESEWLPGGDELTPTLKPKRRPIDAKYAEVIEAMYA